MLRGRHDHAPARGEEFDDGDGPSRLVKAGTICAVLLCAILLSSIGIIVWSRTVSGPAAHPSVPPQAASTPTGPAAPDTTSTGSAPISPAPTRVTWLQVGIGALPFSATAGPTAIRAGVPRGFAHTRAGSVVAAIQILGRLSWAAQTTSSMHAVAAASTTAAAQASRALTYGPPDDPSVVPAVAGFQIVTYSPEQAVVNLALRFNGTLRVVPATLQWTGGDWKLAGAPGPLSDTSWAAVDDLTGYVLFSGQPTKEGD